MASRRARSSHSGSPQRRQSFRQAIALPAVPWHSEGPLRSGPACQVSSPAARSWSSGALRAPAMRHTMPGAPWQSVNSPDDDATGQELIVRAHAAASQE